MSRTLVASGGADAVTTGDRDDEFIDVSGETPQGAPRIHLPTLPPATAPNAQVVANAAAATNIGAGGGPRGEEGGSGAAAEAREGAPPAAPPPAESVEAPRAAVVVAAETVRHTPSGSYMFFS